MPSNFLFEAGLVDFFFAGVISLAPVLIRLDPRFDKIVHDFQYFILFFSGNCNEINWF